MGKVTLSFPAIMNVEAKVGKGGRQKLGAPQSPTCQIRPLVTDS